ncbi:MCP four helix bundle domain-containing protein [Dactylosporangium sp. NPDC049140]|uniref:MCP four helix bundle domain-containing protein n=1 Tax=Dactylosporangium sp. NPDC049140 TaxID=3155647 RepID=UPI003404A0B4
MAAEKRRWLADQPMARKLMLLVRVGRLVGAVVLGVGVYSLKQVNDRAAELYRLNLVPAAHLAALDRAALRVLTNLALSNGPVASKAFSDDITAAEKLVDSEVAAYRATIRNVQQRQLLNPFEIWWGAFRNVRYHRLIPLMAAAEELTAISRQIDTSAQVVKDGFVTPGALCGPVLGGLPHRRHRVSPSAPRLPWFGDQRARRRGMAAVSRRVQRRPAPGRR